ncbi:uncharacterized protein LOC111378519 [Olea europaea var. sylvestris]|uniref:uncharacterized protein LOC111378519 n=1 Tax=Olea europaea var. sylvestris TaxID=158386 RepID=UPI000C1D7E69|nr:uncharacterized protein LOC111378519 [Olea europaea var. sylvestris]
MPTEEIIATLDKEEEQSNATQENQIKEIRKDYKPYSISFPDNLPIVEPILLFPQRFQKRKLDTTNAKQCKVHEGGDVKKEKIGRIRNDEVDRRISEILQRKLSQKRKDPGSFTIPCTIGCSSFDKALCDLGASINLMPISVFKKLGLREVKPTTVTLQLANRSPTYPRGVIEDVLVKGGQLTLRVNEEEARFNIYQSMQSPDDTKTCHIIDFIDTVVKE